MVRPEDGRDPVAKATGNDASGRGDPAGESPVRESVGAPGSRLPAAIERSTVEAQRQKPRLTRERARGPQPSQVTPQGGVISPLLANIYLDALDRYWEDECKHLGVLVRYADDLVVLCGRESNAHEAKRRIEQKLGELVLELHPEKTRVVDVRRGKGSFVFLGCAHRKRRSIQRNPRAHYMNRWPAPRAMSKLRERIHDLTRAGNGAGDVTDVIKSLNPMLRGWGNYFRTGTAHREFHAIDEYVRERVLHWMWRRGGQRSRFRAERWPHERLWAMGLHRLRNRVQYPAQAAPRRPSVSRVPEIGTHGLNGGLANRGAVAPEGK
jgi:RNA-directed DNA polymerase